jgi:hypothetical protein
MKIINTPKFAAPAALAVALLFQTSTTRADDHGRKGGQNHGAATVNFTKWITQLNPPSGVFADMAGVITGGEVGEGTFTGEALTRVVDPATGVITVEAVYHVHGAKHSFTALVHVEQTDLKAVITGVVTDGWLKGHAVEGEYTQITLAPDGITAPAYQGTLEIQRDSKE